MGVCVGVIVPWVGSLVSAPALVGVGWCEAEEVWILSVLDKYSVKPRLASCQGVAIK